MKIWMFLGLFLLYAQTGRAAGSYGNYSVTCYSAGTRIFNNDNVYSYQIGSKDGLAWASVYMSLESANKGVAEYTITNAACVIQKN